MKKITPNDIEMHCLCSLIGTEPGRPILEFIKVFEMCGSIDKVIDVIYVSKGMSKKRTLMDVYEMMQ